MIAYKEGTVSYTHLDVYKRQAYDSVKLARGNGRPTGLDYIKEIFTEFFELHGDRRFADDPAVVGGVARLSGRPVTVIAIEKGHTAKERAARFFGHINYFNLLFQNECSKIINIF